MTAALRPAGPAPPCGSGTGSWPPVTATGRSGCTTQRRAACVPRWARTPAGFTPWTWHRPRERYGALRTAPGGGCVRSGGIGPPCHGLSAAPLQLLSGAEDSFVHVWKLSRNPDTDDVEVSARRERAAGIRERGAAGRCRRVAAAAAARGAAVERRPGPAWAAAAARLLLLLARPRVSTWGAERNGSWAVNRPAVASAAGPALPARRSERCVHSRART